VPGLTRGKQELAARTLTPLILVRIHVPQAVGSPEYYFPVCENPRRSRRLGWRAPAANALVTAGAPPIEK
jgi:hypothetical protein